MKNKKNIGRKVNFPKQTCNDKNCPFHGNLKCRGRTFSGVVVSSKMHKTVVVEWYRTVYLAKYERYEKKRTKIKAHNPACQNAKEGDLVSIAECRPLSKTKNFVVIQIEGKDVKFKERVEALQEGKFKETKKEEINKEKELKKDEGNKS
jgi:small subunit ribosomal protein S17